MNTNELKHFVPRFSRIAERGFGASDVTLTEPSDPFCVAMEGFVFTGHQKHEHPGVRRFSPVFILEHNEVDIDPDDDEP